MKNPLIIPGIAIVAIATLAGIALFKGIDGALFMSAVGLIAGIAGYKVAMARKP